MIRHVAMFRWVQGTTDEQVQEVLVALGQLPAAIPQLRRYRVGPDVGLVDGNWDFAVVADVDDAAAWLAYLRHPAHQEVINGLLAPMVAERAAVQYEYQANGGATDG